MTARFGQGGGVDVIKHEKLSFLKKQNVIHVYRGSGNSCYGDKNFDFGY